MTRREQIDIEIEQLKRLFSYSDCYLKAFKVGAEWADANPTTEEQHRRFLMDRKLYKQLQSDLTNINLEAKSVEQENVSLKHDRKILIKALYQIQKDNPCVRRLGCPDCTAHEALKAIGEGE